MVGAILKSPSFTVASQPRTVYVRRCTALKECQSKLGFLFTNSHALNSKRFCQQNFSRLKKVIKNHHIFGTSSSYTHFFANSHFLHLVGILMGINITSLIYLLYGLNNSIINILSEIQLQKLFMIKQSFVF